MNNLYEQPEKHLAKVKLLDMRFFVWLLASGQMKILHGNLADLVKLSSLVFTTVTVYCFQALSALRFDYFQGS